MSRQFNGLLKFNHERYLELSIFILVILVFIQVLGNGFVSIDDPVYVTDNPHVLTGLTWNNFLWSLRTFDASIWHPLTWLSHMLDVSIYGKNPSGHHSTSLILHISNTLILFMLLAEATGDKYKSFLVAILFGIHPLHVESVAWIAERKGLLSSFFGLISIVFYIRFVRCRRRTQYLLCLLCFLLGLMAKPMIITLPFVLLLLDIWPLNRMRDPENNVITFGRLAHLIIEKKLFFLIMVLFCFITYIFEDAGRIIRPLSQYPFLIRVENALLSYGLYLFKTIWPFNLAVYYPHPGDTIETYRLSVSLFLITSTTLLCIAAVKKSPYLFTGWFLFLGMLVPVIGLIQVGMHGMADRYTYLPLIGVFIMFVWGLADLTKQTNIIKKILPLFWTLAIIYFCVLSWQQIQYWKNTETLFNHALYVTKNNYVAHLGLAGVYAAEGDLSAYNKHYKEAIRTNRFYVAMHHNRAGYRLARTGRFNEAINQFKTAINIDPDYLTARYNLAVSLAQEGNLEAAVCELKNILSLDPKHDEAKTTLGIIKKKLDSQAPAP